ncbi:MAG: peptidoglycan-binding protein [Reyranella sp.]|nr:peptidoglycan-binding protein [Reyranella sp.]
MNAIDDLIGRVIEREGGYVHHPSDRGGPTKYGITQATLADWRGRPVTAAEVEALAVAEARAIYRAVYFRGLEAVTDPKVLEFLFDYSAHSGPGRAVKALLVVLGGKALGTVDQASLFWPLICERLDNFLRIVGRDHAQAVFAEGWANRITEWWRPAGTPVAAHAQLTPAEADGILVKGESGAAVRKLQAALGVAADGSFGPGTEAAVIAFQKSKGLPADGVAGPRTLQALGVTLEVA